jgi:hypothetical protein
MVAVRELFRRRRTHVEDRAIEAQPLSGQLTKVDSLLRSLHNDPRWDVFLRKMGLAD